jgi:hypothetical protein
VTYVLENKNHIGSCVMRLSEYKTSASNVYHVGISVFTFSMSVWEFLAISQYPIDSGTYSREAYIVTWYKI